MLIYNFNPKIEVIQINKIYTRVRKELSSILLMAEKHELFNDYRLIFSIFDLIIFLIYFHIMQFCYNIKLFSGKVWKFENIWELFNPYWSAKYEKVDILNLWEYQKVYILLLKSGVSRYGGVSWNAPKSMWRRYFSRESYAA